MVVETGKKLSKRRENGGSGYQRFKLLESGKTHTPQQIVGWCRNQPASWHLSGWLDPPPWVYKRLSSNDFEFVLSAKEFLHHANIIDFEIMTSNVPRQPSWQENTPVSPKTIRKLHGTVLWNGHEQISTFLRLNSRLKVERSDGSDIRSNERMSKWLLQWRVLRAEELCVCVFELGAWGR